MSKVKIITLIFFAIFSLLGCGRVTSSSGGAGGSTTDTNTNAPLISNILIFPNNVSAPGDIGFTAQVTDTDSQSGDLRYVWDFGDGTTANATAPTHRYTYQGEFYVSLLVYDEKDNYDFKINETKVKVVGGNRQPVISLCQADRITGNIGDTINFSAAGSDPDLDALSYLWEFGDGNNSSLQAPSYAYVENGVKLVKLTVTDTNGATAVKELLIGIGPNIKLPPVIDSLEWDPFFPLDNSPVSFSAQVTDYDGVIVSYFWDFGDGGTSTQREPHYTYSSPGNYQVTLEVEDDQGLVDSLEKYIIVGIGE